VAASDRLIRLLDRTPAPVARVLRTSEPLRRVLAPLLNRLLPRAVSPVRVRSGPASGLVVYIEPRQEKFYWAGTHEREAQDQLVRRLAAGAVFWDVGAHCGFFSLLASRLVGDSGQVVAFEPMPENNARLRRGVAANRSANVEVVDHAVAESADKRSLAAHTQSTMWALVPGREAEGVPVECTTLDDELDRRGTPPDLVKIDVEGAELDVLRGARTLLETARPTLLVEFHGDELIEEARELLPGYELRFLGEKQWLLEPRSAPSRAAGAV
jgi:FkbM family methyltransferase